MPEHRDERITTQQPVIFSVTVHGRDLGTGGAYASRPHFSGKLRHADRRPVAEIVESLLGIQTLIEEGSNNLSFFIDGLKVESVHVGVRSISQESPLRELFVVGLFLAFQDDLEKEVPPMIEHLTGLNIPDSFNTIVTLAFLICAFYGAGYIKDLVSESIKDSPARRKLNGLIAEMAKLTGRSEDEINSFLDKRYKPTSRLKLLAKATVGFFRPSKSQSNVAIEVGTRTLPPQVIRDVPPEFIFEEALDATRSKSFRGLELELHAKDIDREKSGWAAVARDISDKRLKVKLLDGVTPTDLWGKSKIIGSGMIQYKRVGVDMVPSEIHLTEVRDV